MRINKKYISLFSVLLITEIIIAIFVHDRIIRPYIGDILVVFLIYSFVRGIAGKKIKLLSLYVFIFSALVEISQYFQLVKMLNLQDSKFFSTIIGTNFDIKDILCYLVASLILFIWEHFETSRQNIRLINK